MKQLAARCLAVLLFTSPALAAEQALVPLDDPQLFLPDAVGKMINARFGEAFAAAHKLKADYDGVTISNVADGKICLYISEDGFNIDDPALADLRGEGDALCAPRSEVSARVSEQGTAGAPPVPFYHTYDTGCAWQWKQGTGIALWAEDCKSDADHWSVDYDAANDQFVLKFNAEEPYPVVRQFRLAAGETMETLLARLKSQKLVLDDAECVFAPADGIEAPAGWKLWEVAPTGKRKEAFDAQNGDEVPEPPCGDLGYAVDYIGFFAVEDQHPDRVVHIDLGQDGTMIAPFSITFN